MKISYSEVHNNKGITLRQHNLWWKNLYCIFWNKIITDSLFESVIGKYFLMKKMTFEAIAIKKYFMV